MGLFVGPPTGPAPIVLHPAVVAFAVGYAIGTAIEDAPFIQTAVDYWFGDPLADAGEESEMSTPTQSPSGSDCPPNDPCKGLRDQLAKHQAKLEAYKSNPYANDNKGFLANNPPSRHHQIISGRIRNLQRQIENYKRLLEECERKHGIR